MFRFILVLTSHWLGLVDAHDCLDPCALSEPGVSDPKRVNFLRNKLLQCHMRLPVKLRNIVYSYVRIFLIVTSELSYFFLAVNIV